MKCDINFQQKFDQTNVTKLTELIWMELGLIYMQQVENFRNQKRVGHYRVIISQGPYSPLEKQVKYDPETGEILEIYQPPTGATDAIAMQHDVDYVCSNREKKIR